jgi:hypothetical protein
MHGIGQNRARKLSLISKFAGPFLPNSMAGLLVKRKKKKLEEHFLLN